MVTKLVTWASTEKYGEAMPYDNSVKIRSRLIEDTSNGMNFTLYTATGGVVVQIYTQNVLSDMRVSKLFIIHDKDDLGKELGEIVIRELLSK